MLYGDVQSAYGPLSTLHWIVVGEPVVGNVTLGVGLLVGVGSIGPPGHETLGGLATSRRGEGVARAGTGDPCRGAGGGATGRRKAPPISPSASPCRTGSSSPSA